MRLNPHCGVSGVPFMNRTTGADATALSIALRTSVDNRRVCKSDEEIRGRSVVEVAPGERAARAPRRACIPKSLAWLLGFNDLEEIYPCSQCPLEHFDRVSWMCELLKRARCKS